MNPFTRIFLFATFLLAGTYLSAQSFSDLGDDYDERNLRLMIRGTYVKPYNDGRYGGWTVNGSLCMDNADKGGIRVRYENPTLGDGIWMLAYLVRKKEWPETESGLQHAHGAGFIGWMQLYKNVVARDRFILSPGISIADYIIAVEQRTPGSNAFTLDPAGYHFAAGVGLMGSYLVTDRMWIDAYSNFDFCFAKAEYSHPGYKKPAFVTYGVDVCHASGFYAGVRWNQLIDRGDNGITSLRTDISVGYRFREIDKN